MHEVKLCENETSILKVAKEPWKCNKFSRLGTDFYQDTYLYDFHTRVSQGKVIDGRQKGDLQMWSRGCNLHTKRNYACLAAIRESDGAEFALVCGG